MNNRVARLLFATMLLSGIATPARADWQQTRWGMKPAEVRAALPGVSDTPADRRKGWSSDSFDAKLLAPYETPEFTFTAVFSFDRKTDELRQVTLRLIDPSLGEKLQAALQQRYGAPVKVDDFRIGSNILFRFVRWRSEADTIQLTQWIAEKEWSVEYLGMPPVSSKGL